VRLWGIARDWFKVSAVECVFRERCIGMHGTFEAMIASEVNAAAARDAMKSFKLLNPMTASIPSAPAEERYQCPGTAKAPD